MQPVGLQARLSRAALGFSCHLFPSLYASLLAQTRSATTHCVNADPGRSGMLAASICLVARRGGQRCVERTQPRCLDARRGGQRCVERAQPRCLDARRGGQRCVERTQPARAPCACPSSLQRIFPLSMKNKMQFELLRQANTHHSRQGGLLSVCGGLLSPEEGAYKSVLIGGCS